MGMVENLEQFASNQFNFVRLQRHLARIEKNARYKIHVFLAVESESAIKNRDFHYKFQSCPPAPPTGLGVGESIPMSLDRFRKNNKYVFFSFWIGRSFMGTRRYSWNSNVFFSFFAITATPCKNRKKNVRNKIYVFFAVEFDPAIKK